MNAGTRDPLSLNNTPLNELIDRVYQSQTQRIARLCALEGLRVRMVNIEVETTLDVADDPACSSEVKRKATTEQRLTAHGGYQALKQEEKKASKGLSRLDARLECLRSRLHISEILLANETARLNAGL